MKYEIKNWDSRTVFVFGETLKTFEEFSKIIDTIIVPDSKTEVEITSWTESFTFLKDGVEIYFENFYDDENPLYSFELFPIGRHSESDFIQLKNIMNNLNEVK